MQTSWRSRGLVASAALLWGTTGYAAALAGLPDGAASAAAIGAVRMTLGAALLLALPSQRSRARELLARRRLPLLIAAAALAIFQASFFFAVFSLGSAEAALISIALAPQFARSAAGARVWLGRGAALFALCGLALRSDLAAISGGLAAVLSAAAYAFYARQAASLERASGAGLAGTALALLVAGLLLLPLGATQLLALYSPRGCCAGVYLAVITAALAYAAFVRGLRELGERAALSLLALQPLTAAAIGWWLAGEAMHPVQLLALLAMIGAASAAASQEKTACPQTLSPDAL